MKRYFSILSTSVILLLGACSMDPSDGMQSHYSDLCTVMSRGQGSQSGDISFRRDDGAILEAEEGIAGLSELIAGQRIFCTYDLISGPVFTGEGTKTYGINVIGFDKILTKPLEKESLITSSGNSAEEVFGKDKIYAYQASIGDNHLNIEFRYRRGINSIVKHRITLVWDDESAGNEISLRLHHDAFDDIFKEGNPLEDAAGIVSIPIKEVMPQGKTEVKLRINYLWDDGEKSGTITYRLDSPTYSGSINESSIGNNIIMAPMDSIKSIE